MSAIFLSKWALKTIKQYKVWPWSSLENGKGWELLECVVDVTASTYAHSSHRGGGLWRTEPSIASLLN